MSDKDTAERKISLTQSQLAHLGEGVVSYMRQIDSEELKTRFPGLPEIAPGLKLWALFAANGQPILLTDARANALAGAQENNLATVSLH